MTADLNIDVQPDLKRLTAILKGMENGKEIKKVLAAKLRVIGKDAKAAEQAAIRGASIKGVKQGGGVRHLRGRQGRSGGGRGLREPIARAIALENRYSGKNQGIIVRIKQGPLGNLGDIPFALDIKGSWRHPVYGNKRVWAGQVGPTGWWTTTAQEQGQKAAPLMEAAIAEIVHEYEIKLS